MGLFGANPQMISAFERQFGDENGQLVFRRFGKGEAYAVTEAQRDAWRKSYLSKTRHALWATMALMILIVGSAVWFSVSAEIDPNSPLFYLPIVVGTCGLIAVFTMMNLRTLTQPERDLERNVPIAPPLTKDQAKKRFLSRLTYRHLATVPMFGLAAVWRLSRDFDPLHGTGRLVWSIPLSFTALAGIQAYRKWQEEKS